MHRVLVVDDDKVLQTSVKEALLYHNFQVDVANNGKEALLAVYKEKYDLVVMDVNMPEMDGISALTEIKKVDPSVIVIILTAYSNVSDAVKVVKEGAYNYLEKPISSENLVALMKPQLFLPPDYLLVVTINL
jgi:DNA-binding NtrC family response regulator